MWPAAIRARHHRNTELGDALLLAPGELNLTMLVAASVEGQSTTRSM